MALKRLEFQFQQSHKGITFEGIIFPNHSPLFTNVNQPAGWSNLNEK